MFTSEPTLYRIKGYGTKTVEGKGEWEIMKTRTAEVPSTNPCEHPGEVS